MAAYDRLAELKAFEATKAGVKGLVDSGITEIPRMFHMPKHFLDPGLPFSAQDPNFTFPIIDLQGVSGGRDPEKRKQIVDQIRDAAENWGFFQILNHGVPANIMEEMNAGVHRFFDMDVEQKKEFYGYGSTKKVNYVSNFDLYNQPAAVWSDAILYQMTPDLPKPEQMPVCTREIVPKYTEEIRKLADFLFQLLSESLGLPPNHLKDMDCLDVMGLTCNYYPACPQPELTLGTFRHADLYFLTIILQDHIGGLQILRQNHWIDVPYTPGSLVVNVGDLLQLITNDKFKSIVHRVRVKRNGPRASIAAFFGHSSSTSPRLYGPIPELLSEDNPPKYKEITIRDFSVRSYANGYGGNSLLPQLQL